MVLGNGHFSTECVQSSRLNPSAQLLCSLSSGRVRPIVFVDVFQQRIFEFEKRIGIVTSSRQLRFMSHMMQSIGHHQSNGNSYPKSNDVIDYIIATKDRTCACKRRDAFSFDL